MTVLSRYFKGNERITVQVPVEPHYVDIHGISHILRSVQVMSFVLVFLLRR